MCVIHLNVPFNAPLTHQVKSNFACFISLNLRNLLTDWDLNFYSFM